MIIKNNYMEFEPGEVVFIEAAGLNKYSNQTRGVQCHQVEFVGTAHTLFHSNHDYFCPGWWYNLCWRTIDGAAGFIPNFKVDYKLDGTDKGYDKWEEAWDAEEKKRQCDFIKFDDFLVDFEIVLNKENTSDIFTNFKVIELHEAECKVKCKKNGKGCKGFLSWRNSD